MLFRSRVGEGRRGGCVNAAAVLRSRTGTARGSEGRCGGCANAAAVRQGCPGRASRGAKILIPVAGGRAFAKMRGEHCERGGARVGVADTWPACSICQHNKKTIADKLNHSPLLPLHCSPLKFANAPCPPACHRDQDFRAPARTRPPGNPCRTAEAFAQPPHLPSLPRAVPVRERSTAAAFAQPPRLPSPTRAVPASRTQGFRRPRPSLARPFAPGPCVPGHHATPRPARALAAPGDPLHVPAFARPPFPSVSRLAGVRTLVLHNFLIFFFVYYCT